ncbi:hypothetical protein FB451DRAFT_1568664 [Mycena latifolia]|nr:hypothetical protein FB451DRAFT_1568664 [Mycena latifolia]
MLTAHRPVYGESRRNPVASHTHSSTRHILTPSAMNSTDYVERTALERWYTVAWYRFGKGMRFKTGSLVCTFIVGLPFKGDGTDDSRRAPTTTRGAVRTAQIIASASASGATCDARAMHAHLRLESRSLTRTERAADTSRSTDEKSDGTTRKPRPACRARGVHVWLEALVLAALASRGHDDLARRQAAESAPCAGALAKSPACTTWQPTPLGHHASRPLCPRTVTAAAP